MLFSTQKVYCSRSKPILLRFRSLLVEWIAQVAILTCMKFGSFPLFRRDVVGKERRFLHFQKVATMKTKRAFHVHLFSLMSSFQNKSKLYSNWAKLREYDTGFLNMLFISSVRFCTSFYNTLEACDAKRKAVIALFSLLKFGKKNWNICAYIWYVTRLKENVFSLENGMKTWNSKIMQKDTHIRKR